jgi:glycosyltransferase involved in cell wall biosynthesis
MAPLLSVIIPVYNEEKLIARCLESIISQDYPREKYEIIVIDNDSTDRTAAIAKQLGAQVISFKKSHVISAVRQYGISKSKGKILAFMDADSIVASDWFLSFEKLFKSKKIVAACGVGVPDTDSKRTRFIFELYNQYLRAQQQVGIVLPWGFNFAVRKNVYDAVGGFNTSLKSGDDWELGLRIQRRFGKKSIVYSQKLQVYTSTRKQDSMDTLFPYVKIGVINFYNMVLLRKAKGQDNFLVR